MQKKTLCLGIMAALFSLPLSSKMAQANSCDQFGSYVQTPNGECVNLSYLSVLGASRTNLQSAASQYDSAVTATLFEPVRTTFTTAVGDRSRFVSQSQSSSRDLTEEAKRRLQENADNKGRELQNAANINERIERWAFQQQLKVMNRVSGMMAPPQSRYIDEFCDQW